MVLHWPTGRLTLDLVMAQCLRCLRLSRGVLPAAQLIVLYWLLCFMDDECLFFDVAVSVGACPTSRYNGHP